jgi:hypothetical protein
VVEMKEGTKEKIGRGPDDALFVAGQTLGIV